MIYPLDILFMLWFYFPPPSYECTPDNPLLLSSHFSFLVGPIVLKCADLVSRWVDSPFNPISNYFLVTIWDNLQVSFFSSKTFMLGINFPLCMMVPRTLPGFQMPHIFQIYVIWVQVFHFHLILDYSQLLFIRPLHNMTMLQIHILVDYAYRSSLLFMQV